MPDSLNISPLHAEEVRATHVEQVEQPAQTTVPVADAGIKVRHKQRDVSSSIVSQPMTVDVQDADSVPADTLHMSGHFGVVLKNPKKPRTVASKPFETQADSSWVLLGMLVLFLLVAFRMRRNMRYLKIMLQETVSSRSRQNMFVDTMRETTFVIMLNLLCIVCVGLFLAECEEMVRGVPAEINGLLPPDLWRWMLYAVAYYGLQWVAYLLIGNIFAGHQGSRLWLQGFRAGQGLLGLFLFPSALLSIFYPSARLPLLIFAVMLYFSARLLFIFKGIRIFFSRPAYYLVFLYYLCGVEIVPVLVTWNAICLCG